MDLFEDTDPPPKLAARELASIRGPVEPVVFAPGLQELATELPAGLHMGTSSWSFPGWRGLVWLGEHAQSQLSRQGLRAYSSHPLLRCVSLDRSFYRPLSASEYATYAAQVPDHFRFVVKAPSLVCDAVVRSNDGRGMQDNASFLDPALAATEFVQPALAGLRSKIGALVFQLSPLPGSHVTRIDAVLERLSAMLAALPSLSAIAPGAVVAVEVRNPEFLSPAFAAVLRNAGAAYCLGLHPRMPPIDEQLPMLRAMWPSPLVAGGASTGAMAHQVTRWRRGYMNRSTGCRTPILLPALCWPG